MNSKLNQIRRASDNKPLKDIILEAKAYAESMPAHSNDRVFCVTRGAVIAKKKNNETKGHDCWLELVVYWDAVACKGRLKFIPLLSGYQFGDTTLSDAYIKQLLNCEIQYGSDTITFTAENQPPKLKLSPSAINQFCAVEDAEYHLGSTHQLAFIQPGQLILYEHNGQVFRNTTKPAFPGSFSEEWNAFTLGYEDLLAWQKSEEKLDDLYAKFFDEAPFSLIPIIWLPAPKESCFLLALANPEWKHENHDYVATNRSIRFRIDYTQSSFRRYIWNYVRIDQFNPLR